MSALVTLLPHMLRAAPASPRITSYFRGERVELSGRVLALWIAKTCHFLTEEGDFAPGEQVVIDLDVRHWRTTYWCLATWCLGGIVRLGAHPGQAPPPPATALITMRPEQWIAHAGSMVIVGAEYPMLARREVPGGVVPEARTIPSFPDEYPWPTTIHLDAPAVVTPDGEFSVQAMLHHACAALSCRPEQGRTLVHGQHDDLTVLGALLSALSAQGSLVLTDSTDRAQWEQWGRAESVTAFPQA